MQFSDTTNRLGIIQSCERQCNKGNAGISGVTELLQDFTAYVNELMRECWHIIFMAYGGWEYDDSNQTDLPAGTITLTADQASYALPTGGLTIRGIEVLNNGGSNWIKLRPITEEQIRQKIAVGEFLKTSGVPQYYQPVGDSVKIFPASNYTQSAGFKVFFDRGSVAFASTDTTKSIGFAGEYHDIVPLGASIKYLSIKTPSDPTLALFRVEKAGMIKSLGLYYRQRFKDMFPTRITVPDQSREAT